MSHAQRMYDNLLWMEALVGLKETLIHKFVVQPTQIRWTQNWTRSSSWTSSVDPKSKLWCCNQSLVSKIPLAVEQGGLSAGYG